MDRAVRREKLVPSLGTWVRKISRGARQAAFSLVPEKSRDQVKSWAVLLAYGYDPRPISQWLGERGELKDRALWWLYMAARLEHQAHFAPGVLCKIFPGKSRTQALVAAADSCLYGDRVREQLLANWHSASVQDVHAELAMARSMYESLRDGVMFCQGWEDIFAGRGYPEKVLEAMAVRIPHIPGRLLEIGVGGMPLYTSYRDRQDWVASDMLLSGLRIMQHALELAGKGRMICNDAQVLPFPDGAFHVVVSRYVIESVMRPEQMLREIFRVMTPGATAMLPVPPGRFEGAQELYETHRRVFPNRSQFEAMCTDIGYTIVEFDAPMCMFILKKPGKLDLNTWAKGLRSPDSSETSYRIENGEARFADGGTYPVVDGIPVLLPKRLISRDVGVLKPSTSPVV